MSRVVRQLLLMCSAAGIAVISAGSEVSADTYPRQPGIDAQDYAVRLTLLTSDSNEIQAEAAVTLRVVTAGVRGAILDLATPPTDSKGMTVTSVTLGGREITVAHQRDQLHVPIPGSAKVGIRRGTHFR